MAKIRYCSLCERKISPTKKYPWLQIILCFVIFPLVPIGLVHIFRTKEECPICGYKFRKEEG